MSQSLINAIKVFSPDVLLVADVGLLQAVAGSPATAQNDPVGQWLDQSGNAAHCTNNGTAATKPSLNLSVTNGKNSVLFDGVANQLEGPYANSSNGGTCIAVFRHQVATNRMLTTATVSGGTDGSTSAPIFMFKNAGPVIENFAGADLATAATTENAFHTAASWFDGSNANMKVDATTGTPVAYSTAMGTAIYSLGRESANNFPMVGDICFAAFWKTAVSPANINSMMATLKTYYGTP